MKRNLKKAAAALLAGAMMLGVLAGCNNETAGNTDTPATATPAPAADSYPITPEELGSGTPKWSEKETADGWIEVTNEGGETLGYSPDSGVKLLQVDGFAFKDLNQNGMLDLYEDWRQDAETRAADLANKMTGDEIVPLTTHGGWMSFGSSITGADLEYIEAGGRAGVTRSAANEGNTTMAVTWVNALQALCEGLGGYGIPATISVDPVNVSGLIDQNALAATMDTELAHEIAEEVSKQYRSVGITMLLGPQIDIATNPTWSRTSGTYSEDPALNRDLAAAYIDGLQSTYDENGNDLGWGDESVVAIVKHFAGAGASEGGRNDHNDSGKYTVFPGDNFDAHLIPFFDGAFNLAGATEEAGGLMPNYAIAYSTNGAYGDLVGGAYSEYKMDLLRENGYDGFILTDFGIVSDGSQPFGVEDMSGAERFYTLYKNGVDQVGGSSDIETAREGYALLVEDLGEEEALAQLRNSARRFFKTQMQVGLFENPYISLENATSTIYTDEERAFGLETQEKSIIMLKNSDGTIHQADASGEKATVYVPYAYKTVGNFITGYSYVCEPVFDLDVVSQYFNVVTDSVGEPTGEPDAEGNPTYTADDIIRATADEIAACDYALVKMNSPMTDSTYNEATGKWLPASIQYEEYTADSDAVKKESIAGGIVVEEIDTGNYGIVTQEVQENRSYYGNTAARAASYGDYETLVYVAETVPESCKVIVCVAANNAMVWSEVEPLADVILLYYGQSSLFSGDWFKTEALMNIISGAVEPSGLLPMQQPASMEAVEAQLEDVPRDVECYVDADGNTYDFTFGLNWSGVISDERTETYSAEPLTTTAAELVR